MIKAPKGAFLFLNTLTSKKLKIITVVGARPQFIKCAALSKEIRRHFDEIIVHTGQHYSDALSNQFFTELEIPEPTYHLDCDRTAGVLQMADIMIKLQQVVAAEKPTALIVFGDTNSTSASAIVAAKNNIKLVHVEAGMREFDKQIPEETNKLITSVLADFHFCPTPQAVEWLREMGITNHVFHCGDIMIDLIERHREAIEHNVQILRKLDIEPGAYIFATCHRAANTENKDNLSEILQGMANIPMPVILALHPRTNHAIVNYGLQDILTSGQIKVLAPLGYIDTQTLIKNAFCVITDSGGVTKEAYYHQVPGILTDKQTEWVETVHEGWNTQAGPSAKAIMNAFENIKRPNHRTDCLGNGDAALKICSYLVQLLCKDYP